VHCANEGLSGFRTYLPDCRGYELVSPSYKEAMTIAPIAVGEEVEGNSPKLLLNTFGTLSDIENVTGEGSLYEADRTGSSGWGVTPVTVPFSTFPIFEVAAVTPDFATSFWINSTSGMLEDKDLYLGTLGPRGRVFTPIGPGGPGPPSLPHRLILTYVGASSDLSHLVLEARAPISTSGGEVRLWPSDKTEGEGMPSLYEYVGTGNTEPFLVGVSNEGPVATIQEADLISQCGTEFGSFERDSYNAISADGSRVFFTALGRDYERCGALAPSAVEPKVNEVYVRTDGERTVAISEPTAENCEECIPSAPADAQFRGASLDGSKVFFTTTQSLLPSATGEGPYLYEFNFNRPLGDRLTLVSDGDPADGARIQGVMRISEDGSHIYFVAKGVLTGKETNMYGASAEEDADNLYVASEECVGGGINCSEPHWGLVLIGRLSEDDKLDWAGEDAHPAQATSDGRFLVFQSQADLTPDEHEHKEAGQIFEFDSQSRTLVRISHGAHNYNEDGNSSFYVATLPVQQYSGRMGPTTRFGGLALSGDGMYVFFTSEDGLTPQAVTGDRNVYEYHDGEVALISDGHDSSVVEETSGVELIGTDESGRDVFLTTADQLVPQDTDTQRDIFDARIEGGQALPVVRAPCASDSCQGTGDASPSLLTPGTPSVAPETPALAPSIAGGQAKKSKKVKAGPKKEKGRHRKLKRRVKKATKGRG
jgi:hypothetical protein